ncbi:PREDICTED: rho GTPase-activating protein 11A-like isoform X2 [Dinoponera quadriceps]|uniref:Rho GTPase-activating protein 11A-like isoform X2 n=1 Tax=Dinoponera quadriceps TaxID=609295 RepID=A0A6P3XX11_DINQU|nr:PREDICTED: rho GTPase-activating protein 11A-like isoform X2 [Dinoponera quadriceps]
MLVYDVLHKEKVYHIVANDLRSFGVKYRFKKSMLKSERPEVCKDISKRVFKIPLFYQPLDIVNLSSGGIVHVPVFVIQATTFLEKYITQEGLFRKAGSQARQKELMSRLDNGGSFGEKNHAIDVASCLKSFFRDLPEPLIPYIYHDLFVHCALLKSYRIQALLLACTLLPPYHLNTLAFFMEFLKKVSMYEKQNRMSIENLAKVVGPNIMPLRDTSMSAVQNRLQMHLTIIKILIENSQNIGILPPHIAQSISMETSGSTDNGLDSFELLGKSKKKKHRSGSLTRMFNGLKKIVGKGIDDVSNINHQQLPTHPEQLTVPLPKFHKKRKVAERIDAPNIKKKRVADKLDKSKKIRLSLDKFVPKNKPKNTDGDPSDSFTNNYKSHVQLRRWSSINNSSDARKIRKYSDEISHLKFMKNDEPSNDDLLQEYDNVFIDANVNLSDDGGGKGLFVNEERHRTSEQWHIETNTSLKKLDTMDESDNNICLLVPEEKTDLEEFDMSLPHTDTISSSSDHCEEDYVRIPKSEYEDIKNRVSAIESRISQEFGSIYDEENDITTHSVNKVQTAYEKTLEEASIENTLTSDYLAKKLSKELKIRRSGEHKIIRSPSARKIGTLRRRSQEKVTSKRVRRTASWHISPEFNLQHHIQLEKQVNVYPIEKQSTFTGNFLEEQFYSSARSNEITSDNATDEIACLRDQVNTLISRSGEQHKISNNSNLNLSGFKDLHLANNRVGSSVRRASSFHGKDFVDNSSYFDKKVDDLRKSNSHQNIILNNDCLQRDNTIVEGSNEVSWKDANRYFKSVSRTNTPAPQTGRASVAKLRAQNAGMVLAKAKLFGECTTKTSDFTSANSSSKKHCRDNVNVKRSPNLAKETTDVNVEHFKQSYKRTQVSRKQSNKEAKGKNYYPVVLSSNMSPQIKTQITTTQSKLLQEHVDKNYHSTQKFEIQSQKLSNKDPISYQISAKDKTINITRDMEIHQKENAATKVSPLMKMSIDTISQNSNLYSYKPDVNKTPHIKRPLTVKTPKSTKLMRKPPVETRRTPLKATAQLGTPKRQSPKSILKTRTLSMHT